MNFVDKELVALADPASRANYFTNPALERLAKVAFDTGSMTLSGPYSAVFDEVTFGFSQPRIGTMEGRFGPIGNVDGNEARITVSGLSDGGAVGVDAIWRGRIIARSIPGLVPAESADFGWVDDEIDASIIADLGALPAEPQLETERRTRFVQRVRGLMHAPDLFDAGRLDEWLEEIGVGSMGELLTEHRGALKAGVAQLKFPDVPAAPPAPRPLPFAAAILIRDAGLSVGQILRETSSVRESLAHIGLEVPAEEWVKKRYPFIVIWIVPQAVFADADWPGADSAERESRAAVWLGQQGIGLVAK